MAAINKGALAEACGPFIGKLDLWYTSGEPVWMAADSLAFAAKRHTLEERADLEARSLRGLLSVVRR